MHNKFSVLDLSNNKFTGELTDGISNERLLDNSGTITSSISMKVNRLSGNIPYSSSTAYQLVNILTGSLFSCDSSVPRNDSHYYTFECGSSELDNSIYFLVFGCIIGLAYSIFARSSSRRCISRQIDMERESCLQAVCKLFEQLSTWHSSLALLPPTCVNTLSYVRCVKSSCQ